MTTSLRDFGLSLHVAFICTFRREEGTIKNSAGNIAIILFQMMPPCSLLGMSKAQACQVRVRLKLIGTVATEFEAHFCL